MAAEEGHVGSGFEVARANAAHGVHGKIQLLLESAGHFHAQGSVH